MPITIKSSFAFELDRPTDVLLQFEAAKIPEQRILSSDTILSEAEHCARVPAQDDIGERIWIRAEGLFEVDYRAEVEPERLLPEIASLEMLAPHDMPGEAVQYLFDSRYCPADQFQPFVEAEFGGTTGGERVAAIREWIASHFTYQPGTSDARTGAVESFIGRRGICRDYAHVLVTLARASTIPARYVACYAPGVEPPDFHAIAEVFLNDPTTPGGGAWHLVDATGMAEPAQTVKIGIGRDAADVSFLTSFGANNFLRSSVSVEAT
ncbi:transglutaminase family protein [Altererythrobacter arenosus]|uniref:Transglutaminase family protein n=1 Tax=Altererythrobacter arenosus TaxID=3032592 RepID=A0ABY8FSZ7_9SPHN|nr:transglutaminase family protein [Altererythrobacter sp. CAU 1644]WFL78147.1 transglutaminase family protein [Altererythrobacter sp. CAU 1644]